MIPEVKQALLDQRFRDALPEELNEDVQKFLHNPSCACNHPIYRNIMKIAPKQLLDYFPGREVQDIEEEDKKVMKNEWTVINCTTEELQKELRKLGPGRKQLDVARYEDQVTVVINELGY